MSLLDRLRAALGPRAPLAQNADGSPVDPSVLTATAALLVGAGYGDGEFDPDERRAVQKGLRSAFGISREEATALLEDASGIVRRDLASISSEVAGELDEAQRQRVLGLVWTVVYADLVVEDREVALAAQVAAALRLGDEQSQEARGKAFQWFSTSRTSEDA